MDPFSLLTGILLVAGGVFLMVAPRSRWYRRQVEEALGQRAPAVLEDRTRWFRILGYALVLLGLVRLITA
ncbi:MAG: hypothetical protein KM310_08790 [Clostridiales bacterium]|nr:hypothetical protein [Clostridiales bacterium]